jgi:IrrE N-terminal-like domain
MHRSPTSTMSGRSVLALLRSLVPQRRLTFGESLRIAELQANRLLRHFEIDAPPVPDEVVTELPRIRIEREHGLPVSGAAYWNGRYWIITLNADDHPLRRRFSLMHEFKHILDHTTRDFLYSGTAAEASQRAERVADYFAACLLMPKRNVKRLWFTGPQDVEHLADKLRVTPAAARFRLNQLGLIEPPPRCATTRRTYLRRLSAPQANLAERRR